MNNRLKFIRSASLIPQKKKKKKKKEDKYFIMYEIRSRHRKISIKKITTSKILIFVSDYKFPN